MIYETIKRKIQNLCTNMESLKLQEDTYALEQLQILSSDYLVWSSSSMRPSAIVQILNEIIVNNRSTIVEFGCGITTVYIAKILKQYGGHLYSVEDNNRWTDIVSTMLTQNGVSEQVTFIEAPLKKSNYSLESCDWYDEDIVKNLLKNIELDMLIIDGPPAYMEHISLSRYPAIPVLLDQLSDDFCIILDDIDRAGEEAILTLWEKELNVEFNHYYIKGGIAIARSKDGFNV